MAKNKAAARLGSKGGAVSTPAKAAAARMNGSKGGRPLRVKGWDAIEYAEANGLELCKYADPTEDARKGLSVAEARDIAREDEGLIYVDVVTP